VTVRRKNMAFLVWIALPAVALGGAVALVLAIHNADVPTI
jgi:hypothetical protein